MTALADIKVLDFTHMHSGPFASMILADLGADVLKVEPPYGDETRRMTKFSYGEMSAFFVASNRNKRSLVLDLRDEATRPELDRLISDADIIIDNFRPSTLKRMRLDYDSVRAINPSVISVSISGYGAGSPEADSPAYDLLAQARSGVMSITGEPDARPLKAGAPIGDIVAGIYGAVGALAALHERERTGAGQQIEVAMLDAQIAMVHYHYSYFDASGEVLPRVGSEHQNMVPYGIFQCADGFLAIAAVPEPPKFWLELCDSLGHPEWVDDERFSTPERRHLNRDALRSELETVLRTATRDSWFQLLSQRGIPVAPVNRLDDLENDEQVRARDMLVTVASSDYGSIKLPGNPIKMAGALPLTEWSAPPELGSAIDALWKDELVTPDQHDSDSSSERSDQSLKAFDDALLEDRAGDGTHWVLLAWSCKECELVTLGRATRCPSCGSLHGESATLRQEGTLETWTRIVSKDDSYIVGYALIGVEEKPGAEVRLFGRIREEDEAALTLGMRLGVRFESSSFKGRNLVSHVFVPGEEGV